jgi:transcriptional regulator with XRE-family HTH domain
MGGWRIGRSVKALRRRRGWPQRELAARVGTSRQVISRIERDLLDNVDCGIVQRAVEALGGYLRVDLAWQGERLARLLDRRHATLQEAFVRLLRLFGWQVRAEVSFNHYGDRGRIDVLAWHPFTGTLAVVEIKPEIGDLQDTVGRLDVKARLGKQIAADLGWVAQRVVPILVLEDGTTPRRQVTKFKGILERFPLRGREARRWLRDPVALVTGAIVFLDPKHVAAVPDRA